MHAEVFSLAAALVVLLSLSAIGEETKELPPPLPPPPTYTCHKATGPITLDGKLDEPDWQKAQKAVLNIGHFKGTVIESPKAWFVATWDDKAFYAGFHINDKLIQSKGAERDTVDINSGCVELFLDPAMDDSSLYEIHVNALNGLNDLMILRPEKGTKLYDRCNYGLFFMPEVDIKGIKTAVFVDGTVNKNDDEDKFWSCEVMIPFDAIHLPAKQPVPAEGTTWRVHPVRMSGPEVEGGDPLKYQIWSFVGGGWHHHGILQWPRLVFTTK